MWIKYQINEMTAFKPEKKQIVEEYEPRHLKIMNEETDEDKIPSLFGNGKFVSFYIESDIEKLPSGIYKFIKIGFHYHFVKYDINLLNSLIKISSYEDILRDLNKFIKSKDIYIKLRIAYKRGVMLFGPPGTGKTSLIIDIVMNIIDKDSIVIFSDDTIETSYLTALRQDDRLKVFIFEEFTNSLSGSEAKSDMLSFLDGEDSIENSFIIASTNYPEKLPKNIICRPGRFDKIYKIGNLSKGDIIKYAEDKEIKLSDEEVELLNNKTISEIKEILLLKMRDEVDISDSIAQLNKNRELVSSQFREEENYNDGIL